MELLAATLSRATTCPPRGCQPTSTRLRSKSKTATRTNLLDPVAVIAKQLQSPYEWKSYPHDGEASFLLGVVDPAKHADKLTRGTKFPPGDKPTPRAPQLHSELEAMVRALRDAEILAVGEIAKSQVLKRWEIF